MSAKLLRAIRPSVTHSWLGSLDSQWVGYPYCFVTDPTGATTSGPSNVGSSHELSCERERASRRACRSCQQGERSFVDCTLRCGTHTHTHTEQRLGQCVCLYTLENQHLLSVPLPNLARISAPRNTRRAKDEVMCRSPGYANYSDDRECKECFDFYSNELRRIRAGRGRAKISQCNFKRRTLERGSSGGYGVSLG